MVYTIISLLPYACVLNIHANLFVCWGISGIAYSIHRSARCVAAQSPSGRLQPAANGPSPSVRSPSPPSRSWSQAPRLGVRKWRGEYERRARRVYLLRTPLGASFQPFCYALAFGVGHVARTHTQPARGAGLMHRKKRCVEPTFCSTLHFSPNEMMHFRGPAFLLRGRVLPGQLGLTTQLQCSVGKTLACVRGPRTLQEKNELCRAFSGGPHSHDRFRRITAKATQTGADQVLA